MKPIAAIRILACLLAAFVMEGWLAGNTASASCGDYVMVGGHMVGGHQAHGSSGHGDNPMPCRGPSCSRRSAPVPEQPATPPSSQQDWGLTNADAPPLSVEPVGVIIFDRQPFAVLRADPIFRPPRVG